MNRKRGLLGEVNSNDKGRVSVKAGKDKLGQAVNLTQKLIDQAKQNSMPCEGEPD